MAALLKIPPELFERIAEFADTPSLCALRLVCRDANQKVFRTFRDKHFTTRRTYLAKTDLRRLLDIVEHKQLGPALRKLEICVDEIDEIGRKIGMQYASAPFGDSSSGPSTTLRKARSAQRRERVNNVAAHLLTVIFCKLYRHPNKLIEIRMLDSCHPSKNYSHLLDLRRCPPPLGTATPFLSVAEALSLSRLHVDTFSMHMAEWSIPVHRLIHTELDPSILSFLKHLKHLKLSVWYDEHYAVAICEAFSRLFPTTCDQLQTLEINIRSECDDERFTVHQMDKEGLAEDLLLQIPQVGLESFTLTGCQVYFHQLVAFVKATEQGPGIKLFKLEDARVLVSYGEDTSLPLSDALMSHTERMEIQCIGISGHGFGIDVDGDEQESEDQDEQSGEQDDGGIDEGQ